MKFFQFSANAFQWKVTLKENKLHEIVVPIDNEEFISNSEFPIKMQLIDSYQNINEWKGDNAFVDVFDWSNDYTLGGNQPEKGGAFLIISNKVKIVLEKYNLPDHRFYPLEIESTCFKENRDNYFLFHMIGNGIFGDEFIDYDKCTFEEITRDEEENKVLVKKYTEGTLNSNQEFKDVKLKNSEKIILGSYEYPDIPDYFMTNDFNFVNKVFKHDYDILWGAPNFIFVSEQIKNELESMPINNANFFKTNENLIRAFEYEQFKNS
ncbi:hypothetical protein [Aquimarina megaterium]|uniref:hypothetical protein n=1 Tax=Aquimarina megaterium TaxID=1443666 RepID=UPI00046ED5A3|nr:hypothetical protein [Aquimarina megaterium]